jgi:hypothetical protein
MADLWVERLPSGKFNLVIKNESGVNLRVQLNALYANPSAESGTQVFVLAGAPTGAYTQTFATADKTHAVDGATDVAAADIVAAAAATGTTVVAADIAAAAAATSTTIAAATPAAAPAGGTGAAEGAWDTAANRNAAIVTINALRDIDIEVKADHDFLLADVADIRTKYAAAVTLANETKLDYNALLADVADIRTKYAAAVTLANETKADFNLLRATVDDVKRLVNSVIDDLQALGFAS